MTIWPAATAGRISHRNRNARSDAYNSNSVRGERVRLFRPFPSCSSKNVPEASQWLIPAPASFHLLRSAARTFEAPRSASRPRAASTATSARRAVLAGIRRISEGVDPFGQGLDVPLRPATATVGGKGLADATMLLVHRLFSVNRHELEDEREGVVLLADPSDELPVAGERVLRSGDILTRFVVFRLTIGGNPFCGD